MKRKISATIEDDAFTLLSSAAAAEGLVVSEMLERAVRFTCADYQPHRIDLTLLDNGGCSVSIAANSATFYSRRAAHRHHAVGVKASIRVEVPGRIDVERVARALRSWQDEASRKATSGRPLRQKIDGLELELKDMPLKVEGEDPSFVRGVLAQAAATIEAEEVTSLGLVARRSCPRCNDFFVRLSVWAPPDGASDIEEGEWTCKSGHALGFVRSAGSEGRLRGLLPPGESAASAFKSLGEWEGESAEDIATLMTDARRRGARRPVPES